MNGYGMQANNTYASAMLVSAAAMTQDCAKQPEIAQYADDLDRLLQVCMGSLDQLESRVSPVCRGESPTPAGEKLTQIEPTPQTHVGQRLDGMCRSARQIRDRIDAITRRLEV